MATHKQSDSNLVSRFNDLVAALNQAKIVERDTPIPGGFFSTGEWMVKLGNGCRSVVAKKLSDLHKAGKAERIHGRRNGHQHAFYKLK